VQDDARNGRLLQLAQNGSAAERPQWKEKRTVGGRAGAAEPDPLRNRDRRSYMNSMTKPLSSAPTSSFKVRRLETDDVASYRELRLEGLKNHPEAFASSWEYEAEKPLSWWAEGVKSNTVLGGWVDGSPLVGVAGLRVQDAVKLRHKGVLWGMYVRPEARGTGLAAALVQRAVEHAFTLVEEICLTVVTSNVAACRLYRAAGFKEYGLERRALKVGSEYYDEMLMALPLSLHPELAPGD
jgi:RimJ/RimL family protein N-acetyltransferase